MKASELVYQFVNTFNIKEYDYYRQLGIANSLLNKYSEEDILLILNYYKNHISSRGIRSLGYFLVVGDDILSKAKAEEYNKQILNKQENKHIEQKRSKRKSILQGGICNGKI